MSSLDAAIDRLIAAGASLADHEGLPPPRELRAAFWATAYASPSDAREAWKELLIAFGADQGEAGREAAAFARRHSYTDPQSERPARKTASLDFEAVNRSVNLEDLAVRVGFELAGSGRTRSAACLFHSERDGRSFVVWPESQVWKCFGRCNRGGDAVRFVRVAMEVGLWR